MFFFFGEEVLFVVWVRMGGHRCIMWSQTTLELLAVSFSQGKVSKGGSRGLLKGFVVNDKCNKFTVSPVLQLYHLWGWCCWMSRGCSDIDGIVS